MASNQPRKTSRGFVIFGIATMVLLALAIWQMQWLRDEYALWQYTPPVAVKQLADSSAMTPKARRIYYVNHPQIRPKTTFGKVCPSGSELTAVLGCYQSNQRGIYVLQVTNSELQGVEQVTAGHEMLHAAYDRLSDRQRSHVDDLLTNYYQHQLTDKDIKQTIQTYKQTEPDQLVNEMHSIIGTEVADLPPELETYYSQYFTNRTTVVGYYKAYNQAFTTRQQQISDYDNQLNTQKKRIDSLEAGLKTQMSAIDSQRDSLDHEKAAGNTAAYNSGVPAYNRAINSYNQDVAALKTDISTYNALVERRNSIAFEERQLANSL